ncbi:MAG: 3-oxoacyl-ACP reductase family protein [Chloroherpetonaceae bacterium]
MNKYDLKGKIAIVTGARRGIGRSIALYFAQSGAKVVVTDIDKADCQLVVDEIKKMGGEGLALKVDVSLESDIKDMVKTTLDKFGRIDILVNNAGIFKTNDLGEMDTAIIDQILAINLRGTLLTSKYVIPSMKAQNYGKIINLASIAGFVSFESSAVYCATKGAIVNLTRQLACDLGKNKINVNAVAPGVIETPMISDLVATEEGKNALLNGIPYKRLGKPEDIANAVTFLASDDSDYITGHTLLVDGGWIAQ